MGPATSDAPAPTPEISRPMAMMGTFGARASTTGPMVKNMVVRRRAGSRPYLEVKDPVGRAPISPPTVNAEEITPKRVSLIGMQFGRLRKEWE